MGGVLLRSRSEYSQLLESLRHGWAEHGGPFSPPLDLAKFLRVSRPLEGPGSFDNLKSVCGWDDQVFVATYFDLSSASFYFIRNSQFRSGC